MLEYLKITSLTLVATTLIFSGLEAQDSSAEARVSMRVTKKVSLRLNSSPDQTESAQEVNIDPDHVYNLEKDDQLVILVLF